MTQAPLETLRRRQWLALAGAAALAGCSSTPSIKPTPLSPIKPAFGVQTAWSTVFAEPGQGLQALVVGQRALLAAESGALGLLSGDTGQWAWRRDLKRAINAGVGGDAQRAALITRDNELLTLDVADGQEVWRQRLPSVGFTAPLVAGGRVFVLLADRSVHAFDGATGTRLWQVQRPNDPLALRESGLLMPVGNTLLAGLGGRLVAINPDNGQIRWESLVGNTRGTNEVERLVDLVGPAARLDAQVCVRAFQSNVGCVDTSRSLLQWTRPAQGSSGLAGDETQIYGVEADGKVLAWRRDNGQVVWQQEALRFRGPGAPLVLGRSVVTGDDLGVLHFLSRQNGELLQRQETDGSAIVMRPMALGETLVAVTAKGLVRAWRPA